MKKQNRKRRLGKKRQARQRLGQLETLEDRRLLAGDDALKDVIIGVGNLPRRDGQIEAQAIIQEIEQEDDTSETAVENNTLETAQRIPLGFDLGEMSAIDIRGELNELQLTPVDSKEQVPLDPNNPVAAENRDDGSFATANVVGGNSAVQFNGFLGDSPLGHNGASPFLVGGDGDYYRLTDVQEGDFVTAYVNDAPPGGAGFSALILYDEFGRVLQTSESNPLIPNFISHEVHEAGDYYFAVVPFFDVSAFELPDDTGDSLGVYGGPGGAYTITLSKNAAPDVDFYAVDLNPGDILGLNGLGSANVLSLRGPDGDLLLQTAEDNSDFFPLVSPLPGGGNASLAYVASEPGTYYVGVQGYDTFNRYILETRVFRPAIESEPVGSEQILFLDFDGASFNSQVVFGPQFRAELSPLRDYISGWGLASESQLIDQILKEVKQDFDDLKDINPNMKLTILNSRDHADPFGQANVSRVIVGGGTGELLIDGIYGIAESIDVGNFDTSESAVVLLDTLSGPDQDPNSLNHYQVAPGARKVDLVARGISAVISHEAAHFFGAWHTESLSADNNIIDSGGLPISEAFGIGPDLIWGTIDDTDPKFVDDVYSLREGFVGVENVAGMFAHIFVAGQGVDGAGSDQQATGSVFNDLDGNGAFDAGEGGLGGIRVYADINGDLEFGISEPTALTAADGRFSLDLTDVDQDVDVRVAARSGQTVTLPADGSGIPISQIRSGTDIQFGVQSLTGDASGTDFGHAPLTFGPASHEIQGGVRLGSSVTGDDASGEDSADDGVTLSNLVIGETANASITAIAEGFSPAIVSGWIDFNQNGRFESNERVVANQRINGVDDVSFSVPATAAAGQTWARFRMGYERDIAPSGANSVGEVEDYLVTVTTPGGGTGGGGGGGGTETGPTANADQIEVDAGAQNVTLNVLANDTAGSQAVTIQSVSASTVGSSIAVSSDGGRLVYTPANGLTGSETFSYTIESSVGTSTADVTVNVTGGTVDPGGALVEFRLEVVTPGGAPVSTVAVGDNFDVNVYVDDLRNGSGDLAQQGVFAAFADVVFDDGLASIDGLIRFADYFTKLGVQNPPGGDVDAIGPDEDGIPQDDFGGAGIDRPEQTTNQLLMTIPMVATGAGQLEITTNAPDVSPSKDILLYPIGAPTVTADRVIFGGASVTVTDPAVVNASPFTNPTNRFDVDNDGFVVPRDALVLISNINQNGSRRLDPLISAVSTPYLDVSGDGFLSPVDALELIREINRLAAQASSEPEDAFAAAVDAAFSGSDDDEEASDFLSS